MVSEYESRPPTWMAKRHKKAKKQQLKWYDNSYSNLGYCKNILGVVMTMDRIYSTKNALYIA